MLLPLPLPPLLPDRMLDLLQDVESKSRLVRMYYKHRVFMGYCCVSVEVLLLSVRLVSSSRVTIVRT